MNQPWLTTSAATMPWERTRFCIVPDWSVAGVWSTLPDGSYWCPVDWTLDDGRAASLIDQDGSIVVHAYFPSNAYMPFADGQPARRAKT